MCVCVRARVATIIDTYVCAGMQFVSVEVYAYNMYMHVSHARYICLAVGSNIMEVYLL